MCPEIEGEVIVRVLFEGESHVPEAIRVHQQHLQSLTIEIVPINLDRTERACRIEGVGNRVAELRMRRLRVVIQERISEAHQFLPRFVSQELSAALEVRSRVRRPSQEGREVVLKELLTIGGQCRQNMVEDLAMVCRGA